MNDEDRDDCVSELVNRLEVWVPIYGGGNKIYDQCE